jgi:hypothetical protein
MIVAGVSNDNQSSTNDVAIIEIGMDEIALGQTEIMMGIREEIEVQIIEELMIVM